MRCMKYDKAGRKDIDVLFGDFYDWHMRSSAWSVLYDRWHKLIDTQREISISKSPALYIIWMPCIKLTGIFKKGGGEV